MIKIGVLDSGYGNINSICNMLYHTGINSKLISSPLEVREVDKIILPGVGAFDNCMDQYTQLGFVEAIHDYVKKGNHILGICAGAQILGRTSEEGERKGIGILPLKNVKFMLNHELPIPHMGWNKLIFNEPNHPLFRGLDRQRNRFYFVHSFHFQVEKNIQVLANSQYGYEFPSIVAKDNVTAVQFHPEKSQKYGLQLLKNFCEWDA
jgi:glutamine amidotransferase